MEFFNCEIKKIDLDTGEFQGLGAVYNTADQGGDVIEPGAFNRTLKNNDNSFPLLWQHRYDQPIGVAATKNSKEGVRVHGKLNLGVSKAVEALALLKQKAVRGLSFGYETIKHEWQGPVRRLKEIKLFEFSVVTFPMHLDAQVSAVKAVVPFKDFTLADRDRAWDANAAEKRVRSFAGANDGLETSAIQNKYRSAFVFSDSDAPEVFASHKLLIADVINGSLVAVPRGIFAVAAVVQGARGGVDIPVSEMGRVRSHLGKYYAKMDLTPPWEAQSNFDGILAQVIGFAQAAQKCNDDLLMQACKSLSVLLPDVDDLSDSGDHSEVITVPAGLDVKGLSEVSKTLAEMRKYASTH